MSVDSDAYAVVVLPVFNGGVLEPDEDVEDGWPDLLRAALLADAREWLDCIFAVNVVKEERAVGQVSRESVEIGRAHV